MFDDVFQIVFILGWISIWVVRLPSIRQSLQTKGSEYPSSGLDKLLVTILLLGTTVLPFLYLLTPWLDFANYNLLPLIGWVGAAVFLFALWLLWRAHVDLGRNFSQDLEIKEDHSLVTLGVYRYIRHPMYAAAWIIAISQVALLQNWIAGSAGFISLLPFYLLRVPREEQMMLERFGEEYQSYIDHTGRIIPF